MRHTSELSGLKDETKPANRCVSCGKETPYICPFTHGGPQVPLCGEPSCRDKHESEGGCIRVGGRA